MVCVKVVEMSINGTEKKNHLLAINGKHGSSTANRKSFTKHFNCNLAKEIDQLTSYLFKVQL